MEMDRRNNVKCQKSKKGDISDIILMLMIIKTKHSIVSSSPNGKTREKGLVGSVPNF